jgi:hypothetical protein
MTMTIERGSFFESVLLENQPKLAYMATISIEILK